MNHTPNIFLLTALILTGCQTDNADKETNDTSDTADTSDSSTDAEYVSPDFNADGNINILVLGTNSSINGGQGFSPDQIAIELNNILDGDTNISSEVNVVAEDMHTSKPVTIGLGGNGSEYTYDHHIHSLTQYYYWPENADLRMDNLTGNGDQDWDYVVIGADPYIMSKNPGFYALGVNKIATKVVEGDAQPLLLMMWSDEPSESSLFEEFAYRIADGASVEIQTVPAGLAWGALSDEQQNASTIHPTPNGAYLAAASIYSHITRTNAADSDYQYDSELANVALNTVNQSVEQEHYAGAFTFDSPFAPCHVTDEALSYNHTGSSSENGILGGLNWVFDQATETLENGGNSPITFNYGRANTNFEAQKRYQIDRELFRFSFGFPMQDHGNHGDESMLYGIDKRDSGVVNDTDVGVARYMIEQFELPYGRAVPIRTLFAQMREVNPEQSAYRDSWHMHRDLDKAIGAYMYTLLTSKCALGEEPADNTSSDWNTWRAHKIGCDTAWTMMYLEGSPF